MELALIILAGIGIVLFLVNYLAYVLVGFKHHFVTGIIAIFPGLNIVTVPSLWHQSSKKVVAGFVGLSLAGVAWFMGANTGIRNILTTKESNETVILSSQTSEAKDIKAETTIISSPTQRADSSFNESEMQGLPEKALYKMVFENVPVDKLGSLLGRIVKITKINNDEIEGSLIKASSSSVLLQNGVETEIPLANIKQISLMVKKANK